MIYFTLLVMSLYGATHGAVNYIGNVDQFISFSNAVNNGATYSGTTVFLTSDINLAGRAVRPIGVSTGRYFLGTFDGQGHVISNLRMNEASSEFGGLFGYTPGATIRNIVMDESCTIRNSASTACSYIGGILGESVTKSGPCVIENCVNMAKVYYKGSTRDGFHLGGVVGVLWKTSYDISVDNCVNYGTITHEGTTTGYCDVGGIVGHLRNHIKLIQNCFNYGILRLNGQSNKYSVFGGIAGYSYSDNSNYEEANIINSLSAGVVENNTIGTMYVGGILGCVRGKINVTITHCFWTEGEMYCKDCDQSTAIKTTVDSSLTELNSTVMEEIFEYETESGGSSGTEALKRHILHLNGGKIGDFPEDTMTVLGKEFPIPVKERNEFLFWCEDKECIVRYDPNNKTSNATDVYAMWKNNTLTFDANGGEELSEKEMTVTFDKTYGDLPEPSREGYTFAGWFIDEDEEVTNERKVEIPMDHTIYAKWVINTYNVTFVFANGTAIENVLEYGKEILYPEEGDMKRDGYTFDGWDVNDEFVPASDLTITAQWTANNYTVRFDVNGGDGLTEDEIRAIYDDVYGELPEPIREGYTFIGWFTEEDEEITNETTVKILVDITITAKWNPKEYTVRFDVNGGDGLTEEEMNVTFDSAYGDSLPTPTRTNYTFIGWFTEENEEITSEVIAKISKDHTLTAQWKEVEYNVTFVFANGTVIEKPFKFNEEIEYPEEDEMRRDGYTFDGWDTNDKFAPGGELTITAKWTPNNYTVRLDANGGDALTEDEMRVTYDGVYGDSLPEPTREGYTFAGWFTDEDKEVTSETVVKIPKDHTLHAEWKQNPTSQVEIVFGSKDLSQDEAKDFVDKNTDVEFKIVKFEKDDNKVEIRIIIQFNDPKDAENFIEKLSSSDDSMMALVKSSRYASEEFSGFSVMNYPIVFLHFLFLIF